MNVAFDMTYAPSGIPLTGLLDDLEGLALYVLTAENAPETGELSVSFVDTQKMRELNRQYRNVDRPTNVLSFAIDPDMEEGQDLLLLGDVIIAPQVAEAAAQEYQCSLQEELQLLLVHGILHILGYDHIDDSEAEVMEAHEDELLCAWRKLGAGEEDSSHG
ncbi:MAG: rRNA maturation RNase YbeY [Actinomycetia bacterium]|nr:rRNA maturation RNase YbeY [Actinomycetes bacterium]